MEYAQDQPTAADWADSRARDAHATAKLAIARLDRLLGLLTNKGILDTNERIWVMTGEPPP